jgi:hypothetical protein
MEKSDTYIKEHKHCEGSELLAGELTPFERAWRIRVIRELLTKRVCEKARDFSVFYFDIAPRQRNDKHAAACYGIERETAASYLLRADSFGWLKAMESPTLAGEVTLPRVYQRRVFWSTDYWSDAGSY